MNKRNLVIAVVLIAVAAGAGAFYLRKPAKEADYRIVTVQKGPIKVTVLATGIVQPENRVDVKPPISGRAEKVLVKEGDLVHKGQALVWMSSTERAALLDAARARGPEELKHWEDLYRPTPILAPVSGTVILRNIEPGQTFATTDSILVMSDRLTVQAQVDETDIAQIKAKQGAQIVLDAYPQEKIAGHVEKIAYEAKTVNNVTTYIVTVIPEKAPDFMRSGMTANVSFETAGKPDALWLPAEAVKVEEGESYVLSPPSGEDAPPSKAKITTGLTDGKRVEILSGVSEGDKIAIAQPKKQHGAKAGGTNPFSPMPGGAGRRNR